MKKFKFICKKCGHEHIITDDYYLYNIIKNNEEIQEQCFNCGETLFLNKESDIEIC